MNVPTKVGIALLTAASSNRQWFNGACYIEPVFVCLAYSPLRKLSVASQLASA